MHRQVHVMARSVKGAAGTYLCVLMIVLVVGFYTLLQLGVLDEVTGPEDVDIKSATQILEEKKAATSHMVDNLPAIDVKQTQVTEEEYDDDDEVRTNKDRCEDFDHGDTSYLEDVTSIFNCGSEDGTCLWYHPGKFLDEYCGVGKEFFPQLEYMKELYDSQELWLSGPPIVLPWASIVPENMRQNPYKDGPWNRHNLSMTHVHKTGGTSLVTAFGNVLSRGAKGKRHTVYMPGRKTLVLSASQQRIREKRIADGLKVHNGPGKSVIYGSSFNQSSAFLDGATKYKREGDWGEKDHTLLAVVRDPAERFISAIGQATGAFGSSQNGIGKQLLDECLKDTTKATLNCFIDLMKTNSTWIEVHFTPMVLEISFATIYKDIPVAVFPFDQVPNLLKEFATNPVSKRKDGNKPGYRKSDVLTNMTVADYDDDMLKKLCEVYKMDVIFMKHIGMSTNCDKVMDF